MNFDEAMNQFRLASRMIFNSFFRIQNPHQDNGWLLEERFSEVEKILFRKLVTEPASLHDVAYGNVQPDIFVQIRNAESVPVMINREIDTGYWDFPLSKIKNDAKLTFVRFFDWDQLDYRDNRYVRVQIKNFPAHPEVNGKHALIESHYVSFVCLTKQNS